MSNASNIYASAFLGKLLLETNRFIKANSERHSQRLPTSAMLSLGDAGNAYVRLDFTCLDNSLIKTFTIASIELATHLRGKGILTKWIASLRDPRWHERFTYVVFECILNDRLAKSLRAKGAIDLCDAGKRANCPTLALAVVDPSVALLKR